MILNIFRNPSAPSSAHSKPSKSKSDLAVRNVPAAEQKMRRAADCKSANAAGKKTGNGPAVPVQHDSWSSRASSILKDPEGLYVSRLELLKNITLFENPNFDENGGDRPRAKKVRVHDSWSSRASSILAAAAADQVSRIMDSVTDSVFRSEDDQ